MGDAVLTEMPAKQHELPAFRVPGGEVHQTAVEVLHLDTGLLEVGDDELDLVRDCLDSVLCLLHVIRVEPAPVAHHLAADRRQPPARSGEPLPGGNQSPDERLDDGQGVICFLLAEEAHAC